MTQESVPVFDYVRRVRMLFERLPAASSSSSSALASSSSSNFKSSSKCGQLVEVIPSGVNSRRSTPSGGGGGADDTKATSTVAGDGDAETHASDADTDDEDDADARTVASTSTCPPPQKKRRVARGPDGRPYVPMPGYQLVRPFRYEQFVASNAAAELLAGSGAGADEEAADDEFNQSDASACPDFDAAHSRIPLMQRAYAILRANHSTGLTRMNFAKT